MTTSNINIEVTLDNEMMPEALAWTAPGGGVNDQQKAKALLLSLWDGDEKSALRIDLWTQKMMVDEMNDFFYQTFLGLADTFQRATKHVLLAQEIKDFAKVFHRKATEQLSTEGQ